MSAERGTKACMPCTRSLLEAIQCLHQAAQMIRTIRISKSRRLTHINLLLKNTMEKGILHIQLAKGPTMCDSQREQNTDGSRLDVMVESRQMP